MKPSVCAGKVLAQLEAAELVTVRRVGNAFVKRVLAQPKLWVIEEGHGLAA
jgi:hypothetical protein